MEIGKWSLNAQRTGGQVTGERGQGDRREDRGRETGERQGAGGHWLYTRTKPHRGDGWIWCKIIMLQFSSHPPYYTQPDGRRQPPPPPPPELDHWPWPWPCSMRLTPANRIMPLERRLRARTDRGGGCLKSCNISSCPGGLNYCTCHHPR